MKAIGIAELKAHLSEHLKSVRRGRTLTTEEAAERLKVVTEWLEAIDLVLLRPPVLSRASDPLPTPLGTLNAVHLATALIWRDRMGSLPIMATHDAVLGLAARTFGFDVLGMSYRTHLCYCPERQA